MAVDKGPRESKIPQEKKTRANISEKHGRGEGSDGRTREKEEITFKGEEMKKREERIPRRTPLHPSPFRSFQPKVVEPGRE